MAARLVWLPILGCALAFSINAQEQALREAAQLDAEHRCEEAEQYYRKALAAGKPSTALLNNLGNHYLICGDPERARAAFERILTTDPSHLNANLQLARMASARKDGARALEYLAGLGDRDPEVLLARAEAFDQAGRREAALGAIDKATNLIGPDPRLLFALGVTCGRMSLYERAEAAFSAVLARYPDDFDVLYNTGRAAARAGHYERARGVFATALRVRPADVDSLYELGRVETSLEDYPRAVFLLAKARELAPQRPDVLLALARAAQRATYYGDSILAYDEYLKLRPGDDMVRRDRALVLGYTFAGLEEGRKELARYVEKHPEDATGFYDLALLAARVDPAEALKHASTAVRLDPQSGAAHYVCAWSLQKLGRTQESVAALEHALRLSPRDARALDLLGLDYLDLGKPAEAEKALRQALGLSPADAGILFHLSRALIEMGRGEEAKPFLEQFRKLQQTRRSMPVEQTGIIESASLPDAERSRRLVDQLRQLARTRPGDPAVRLNLASALLSAGRAEEAATAFRDLLAMNPVSTLSHEAGVTLLRSEQYSLARDFLKLAAVERPAARLDLAVALFFADGPEQALPVLEQIPAGQDTGDAALLRAWILDAAGRFDEADRAIDESLRHPISRPRLAQEAALMLVRRNQGAKALALLERAPNDPGVMLTRVAVLSALGRAGDAAKTVKEIENRWPEWDRAYLMEGMLLERAARVAEARQRINIAIALGSKEPAAQCALARMTNAAAPDTRCACQAGLYGLFFPPCPAR